MKNIATDITTERAFAEFCMMCFNDNGTVSRYPAAFDMKMGQDTILDCRFTIDWHWFMYAYRLANDCLKDISSSMQPNGHPILHNTCTKGDMLEVDVHCAVREFDLKKAVDCLLVVIKWIQAYKEKETNKLTSKPVTDENNTQELMD